LIRDQKAFWEPSFQVSPFQPIFFGNCPVLGLQLLHFWTNGSGHAGSGSFVTWPWAVMARGWRMVGGPGNGENSVENSGLVGLSTKIFPNLSAKWIQFLQAGGASLEERLALNGFSGCLSIVTHVKV